MHMERTCILLDCVQKSANTWTDIKCSVYTITLHYYNPYYYLYVYYEIGHAEIRQNMTDLENSVF